MSSRPRSRPRWRSGRLAQERHRALDAPRHQVAAGRLAVGPTELAAEVPGRHVRIPGERLDVQRPRVLAVGAVADAAKPSEVAEVFRCGGFPGHRQARSTATGIRTPVSAVRGRRPSPLDDSGASRQSSDPIRISRDPARWLFAGSYFGLRVRLRRLDLIAAPPQRDPKGPDAVPPLHRRRAAPPARPHHPHRAGTRRRGRPRRHGHRALVGPRRGSVRGARAAHRCGHRYDRQPAGADRRQRGGHRWAAAALGRRAAAAAQGGRRITADRLLRPRI